MRVDPILRRSLVCLAVGLGLLALGHGLTARRSWAGDLCSGQSAPVLDSPIPLWPIRELAILARASYL